jgi:MFS family permease
MRNSALLRILLAQGLSSLGTSISTVALAVMVFARTGSVLHMGGILAAATLPVVVMTFLGGALLDRYPSRRLMIVADLARAGLIMTMPFAASRSVALVYVVAAALGTFTAVFNPAQVRLVGELADPDALVRANSYLSVARDGCELGGYLAGGVLVYALGYFVTFALDGVSYLASAVTLAGLVVLERPVIAVRLRLLVAESPRAIVAIWSSTKLRANMLMALFAGVSIMMTVPNAYALALEVYGRGPQGFAAMETVTAAGWIVGGLLAGRLNFSGDRNTYTFLSAAVMAMLYVGVGLSGNFWVAVFLLAAVAVANVGLVVASMTLFQEIEERPDKGRIISARMGFGALATLLGFVLGGALGQLLGVSRLFVLCGVACLLLSAAAYLPYRFAMRRVAVALPPGEDTM